MASLNVVQTAVEKASTISKRSGKWAAPKEIDAKASPKQPNLQSLLSQLVKDSRIEKKAGMLLYRPQEGAGPGGQGKGGKSEGGERWEPKPRRPPKKPDGKKPGRPDRGDKPRRPPKKPGDREDRNERERQRKRDEMERRNQKPPVRKKPFVHPKDKKSGRRDIGKTIARGVATRAVASGISQGIAPRAITTMLM